MNLLGKLFFRGLAAILPLAATGWLVWMAVAACEDLLRRALRLFVAEQDIWPGMGLALSIVLVMAVGLLMYSFVVRQVYLRLTALLERIPIVKSVYGMVVDVARLFGSPDERPFRQVVLVERPEGGVQIGFLTRDDFADLPEIGAGKVAVYLPMSYQLGGFTVIVPRERVREVAMKAEDALRFCITAGVGRRAR
jgi:uncharacterized membrane protein